MPKNWCFWIVLLEKTLESPLDCKEIQPVHPKENQPWIFFGRTNAEAETPILWPPDMKSRLFGKDCDAGKDWGQEKKGTTGDEMVGWHHQRDGHEFEQAPGHSEGQGSLVCCSPWGHKESGTNEWLNSHKYKWQILFLVVVCLSLRTLIWIVSTPWLKFCGYYFFMCLDAQSCPTLCDPHGL